MSDLFTGPTAIAYSDDPVAAAKGRVEFAKKNDKLTVVGGAMGDSQMLDADGVKALAKLPSLDELRGKLVGMLQAPATKLAGVLQAPGRPAGPGVQCLRLKERRNNAFMRPHSIRGQGIKPKEK